MTDCARWAAEALADDGPCFTEAQHAARVSELASDLQLTIDTWKAAHPETEASRPLCEECDGTGTVLDAPNRVLDGVSYQVPCVECHGTGHL